MLLVYWNGFRLESLLYEEKVGKFEDSIKFERKGVVAKIVSFLLWSHRLQGEAVFLMQRYSASSAEWNICWENIAFDILTRRASGVAGFGGL